MFLFAQLQNYGRFSLMGAVKVPANQVSAKDDAPEFMVLRIELHRSTRTHVLERELQGVFLTGTPLKS